MNNIKWNKTKLLLTQLKSGDIKENCDISECLWDETTLLLCEECPEYAELIIKYIYKEPQLTQFNIAIKEVHILQHVKTILVLKKYINCIYDTFLTIESIKYLINHNRYIGKHMTQKMFKQLDLSYIKKVHEDNLIYVNIHNLGNILTYSIDKQKYLINNTNSLSYLCSSIEEKKIDISYITTLIEPEFNLSSIGWCIVMGGYGDIIIDMIGVLFDYDGTNWMLGGFL